VTSSSYKNTCITLPPTTTSGKHKCRSQIIYCSLSRHLAEAFALHLARITLCLGITAIVLPQRHLPAAAEDKIIGNWIVQELLPAGHGSGEVRVMP
jgi:hypothetical protein